MPRMSMVEAIRDAMDCKMAEDERVVVFGEDVGYFGGVFRCTDGLQRKYGKSRCFDAPINESGIVGVAIGMGAYGLSPRSSSPTMSTLATTRSCPKRRGCATARAANSSRRS
jgi:pyruvate/2-oxoglutarate/acetoin dehydrogenase E1 component